MEHSTFDKASRRRFDANGFLHVSLCHISKEQVAGYYGAEIPDWRELGLDPQRVYQGFRPAAELERAAPTFNGLPLLNEHAQDSAAHPQKDRRIGNLGTEAAFRAPYLDNSLIIQDAAAIEALNPQGGDPQNGDPQNGDGLAARRELSASYRYDPVFTPGVFDGRPYDFIMTNIRGNHVAIVEEGRAGSDVVVSDSTPPHRMCGHALSCADRTAGAGGDGLQAGLCPAQQTSPIASGPTGSRPRASSQKEGRAGSDVVVSDSNTLNPQKKGNTMELKTLLEQLSGAFCELAARLTEAVEALDPALPGDDGDGGKKAAAAMVAQDAKVAQVSKDANAVAAKGIAQGIDQGIEKGIDQGIEKARADFRAQIEAAREVRPLIGEVDPLAFDSAEQIYTKALELYGRPTKIANAPALREMVRLAIDARPKNHAYPVVAASLVNDADPAFAGLGRIRKA